METRRAGSIETGTMAEEDRRNIEMAEEDRRNIEIAQAAYSAFNRGDLVSALEGLDPEIEWHMWDRFTRKSRVFHGHAGVREVFQTFAENFDDFRTEPHDFIGLAGRVVVPVRLSGRPKGGGERVEFELVQVWSTRSHRAVRLDVYGSLEEAREAMEAADSPSRAPQDQAAAPEDEPSPAQSQPSPAESQPSPAESQPSPADA
jgi:ketosteroid isomerase-like protein